MFVQGSKAHSMVRWKMIAVGVGVIPTLLVWMFRDVIGVTLFYSPAEQTLLDSALYEKSTTAVATLLTLFFTACGFAFYFYKRFSTQPKQLTQEFISDLMFSREQFRLLYENSPVPYFLMDDAGNIRNPNRATLRFFEGTSEECASLNFFGSLIGEEKTVDTITMLRTKITHSIPIEKHEVTLRTLKNNLRTVLMSVYSLDQTSLLPFKHLVTIVDITKEKEHEQVKTDFLLLASHQLRTPLTAIKWYADYLLSSKDLHLNERIYSYLKEIYKGSERMNRLIATLLTVSRIEMGTLAPVRVSIDAREAVREVLHDLSMEIEKKHLKMKLHVSEDSTLVTDRTMFQVMVHNLLTNAIKYTPSGGSVIVSVVSNQNNLNISVKDTGCGIPPDEQEKIFTKMFRASNAKKMSAQGTGLGLYLTRSFVEKLGGSIDFVSTVGQGSTFTITLPRVASEQ